jgi:hypothetical protein
MDRRAWCSSSWRARPWRHGWHAVTAEVSRPHPAKHDPAKGDYWSTLETVENGYEADWEFSYDLLQR